MKVMISTYSVATKAVVFENVLFENVFETRNFGGKLYYFMYHANFLLHILSCEHIIFCSVWHL